MSELKQILTNIAEETRTKIIPGNIKQGVTVFGVEGALNADGVDTSNATATSEDILEGKSGYVKGELIEGTIPNNGAFTYTPTNEDQTIPQGYTTGGVVKGDENLKAENILSGTSIFGVEGTVEVLDTSDANASNAQILEGYSGYVNGEKINGSMANKGALTYNSSENTQANTINGYVSSITVNPINIETMSDYNTCYALSAEILGTNPTEFTQDALNVYLDASDYNTSLLTLTDKMGNVNCNLLGTYIFENNTLKFSSDGRMTIPNISKSYGSWEIYLKIPSTYIPIQNNNWYELGCILGNEYSGRVQDFGIVIDKNGYLAIGYSESSVQSSTIQIADDTWHHLILTYTNGRFNLYCDNNLVASVSYTMTSTIPAYLGILWNGVNTWSPSYIPADFAYFRHYTKVLSANEIQTNYNFALALDKEE